MSGYVFRAEVGNPEHPEYGIVIVPFPMGHKIDDHENTRMQQAQS